MGTTVIKPVCAQWDIDAKAFMRCWSCVLLDFALWKQIQYSGSLPSIFWRTWRYDISGTRGIIIQHTVACLPSKIQSACLSLSLSPLHLSLTPTCLSLTRWEGFLLPRLCHPGPVWGFRPYSQYHVEPIHRYTSDPSQHHSIIYHEDNIGKRIVEHLKCSS